MWLVFLHDKLLFKRSVVLKLSVIIFRNKYFIVVSLRLEPILTRNARKTDQLHALYKLSRYRLHGYLFIVILFGKI